MEVKQTLYSDSSGGGLVGVGYLSLAASCGGGPSGVIGQFFRYLLCVIRL